MLICILTKNVITSCSVTMMLFLHLEVKPLMTLTTVLYLSCALISGHLAMMLMELTKRSKFSAFHDETGRLNVDGMNIISNDGSNKLNRSRKARVSYKVQRTINASLNAATSTRAVS